MIWAAVRALGFGALNAPKPSARTAAPIKHGELARASDSDFVECVSDNPPEFTISVSILAAELIKLVYIAIRVGPVAFADAVIVQTDIGVLNSGNMTSNGSHGTILSRKIIRSRAKSAQANCMLM